MTAELSVNGGGAMGTHVGEPAGFGYSDALADSQIRQTKSNGNA